MSYKTLKGYTIDYPWYFIGKSTSQYEEKYKRCFDALQYAEQELISKRDEVIRLQHENDFMRRLIEKHMIGE